MSKYLAYALLFVLAGCATRNDSLPAEELKIPATMPDVDINQEYCNGMISNASMAYGGLVPAAHYLDQMGKQAVFITRVQQECIGRANAAAHQTEKAYNWFRRSADNGSIPALVRAAAESTQLKKDLKISGSFYSEPPKQATLNRLATMELAFFLALPHSMTRKSTADS